ncbi:hypothetical protein H0266_00840 [Halobacillus locisalis]|uniref:PilX N-terminal n=1 Tax=Halobacillus locisalis TaxID=220753 RepID=A0A838CMW1_9BACI|nr:hypothetical protein [Halobacillus locisalis]MBA2173437.1 hypothetical protein [Halobacillus locisalis]
MKGKFTNERGAALVLVLLSIFLVMIFGAVLASQINNSGLQVKKSQHNVQAEALAVMGETYFIESIELLKTNQDPVVSIKEVWEEEKDSDLDGHREIDDNRRFNVELISSTLKDSGQFQMTYKSIGTAYGTNEEIVNTISLNSSSSEEDWIQDILDHKEELISNKKNGKYKTLNCRVDDCTDDVETICENNYCAIDEQGNIYLEGTLQLNGKGNNEHDIDLDKNLWVNGSTILKGNSSVSIDGFAYFEGSSLTMKGNTSIDIAGDAYFDFLGDNLSGSIEKDVVVRRNAYFEIEDTLPVDKEAFCIVGKSNVEGLGGQSCP